MSERATSRIEAIVSELLDYSKTRMVQPCPTSPVRVLESIREAFPHLGHTHGIQLDVEADFDPGDIVLLDEGRLHRALMNLISNSVDAIGRRGRISLTAHHDAGHVVFSVEDDGPGVPDADMENLFTAFYSTKGGKGTGLGLAMVSKFCSEHGGVAVALHGHELGGLRVEMRLPRLEAAPAGNGEGASLT